MYTVILILLLISVASSQAWLNDKKNVKDADNKTPHPPKEYIVNLDLPQSERWTEIGELYADRSWMLVQYLRANLPPGWLKPLEKLADGMIGFFADYGDEMVGYAQALNITQGDIVMINLVYQLERLGLSCDSWNNTGPVNPIICPPPEPDALSSLFLLDQDEIPDNENEGKDGPGMCTSFVAKNPDGTVYHARNLDWNLQDSLKQFIINVQFTKGGSNLYKSTTIVGFVGMIHAVKPNAFAWSLDARRKGGNIPFNVLSAALQEGVRTPEQHARYVFETEGSFDSAVTAMVEHAIVNPVYYIVSGTKDGEGVVIARDRKGAVNEWWMKDKTETPGVGTQDDFWVGVTNYDLNRRVPPSDDRSTPMTDNVNALDDLDYSFGADDLWGVLETWPTMNQHTDCSAVVDVKQGTYDVKIWFDHGRGH